MKDAETSELMISKLTKVDLINEAIYIIKFYVMILIYKHGWLMMKC